MTFRYYVETYDAEKGTYTPQPGVRRGPYTLWGLRKAICKLRDMGYPCDYSSRDRWAGDPAVSVWREPPKMIRVGNMRVQTFGEETCGLLW